ncbi:protein tyrosine kinase [Rugosibacter aromaticivorans]|uniref:Protein tyrosine kinase n=1 Tax=Rugosibacter aromaticivorans TaxID=1565605 RepID=A0A0C5JA60_9PROT|nr:XrtA-associated tyrosine autokinase [Rugosibacter aromaticivorans]AJP48835.1 protein tyrosine kinase [Rugosibacter aromaticivorans]TBR16006.1 MAG: tyrosine-protein kinase family protein [Rugosibacter sp.]
MDIIEQAAKRLAELRQSGVDVPGNPVEKVPEVKASASPQSPDNSVAGGVSPVVGGNQALHVPAGVTSRRTAFDMVALASRGIITPDTARSRLGAELRVLKRPLLQNVLGKSAARIKDANLIMITSAVPGEGKSYLAANLAMSIAMELDHTVLLVDADVERPSLPRMLGFEHGKGLLDVLLDSQLDLSQVMLRTNIEKLSILPAGTHHPRATELLASAAMNKLLAEMARRYPDRIIIFDSPPLLVTTEARALAGHMGQVVVVVRADSTSHAEVKHAVAALEVCPVKMVVLNQTTGHFDGHGYDYGYGYGYGHGYGAESNDQPRGSGNLG